MMQSLPNLVYIFADDMGVGDVSCLNEAAAFKTGNLDKLAAGGMRCTDAHSSSAVCTPSRYSVLTGRYNWRSVLKQGVTGGYSRPILEDGRLTVASMLREQGYRTACIGKWHLVSPRPTRTSLKLTLPPQLPMDRSTMVSTTSTASAPRWICRPTCISRMTR